MEKNFSQAKIYCIECNITGKKYIGSTCKSLSQRLKGHESDYKRYLNEKYCYVTSFDILQLDDYVIYLLEKVNCDTQEELNAFEGHYIKKFKDFAVNKKIEGKTIEEKKQEANQKAKQYHQDNKESLNQKKKEKFICECGSQYTYSHKAEHQKSNKHKEYIADESDSE